MAKESKKNIGKKGKKREKQRAEQSVEIPVQLYYILSLLVCAIAIYTLATLVSYIYSWSSDQNLLVDNIFNPTVQVQNQGGKVGVLYGELLISKLFGIGAFFIPLALFFISYYILKKRWIAVIRDIIVYLFLAILTSLLSSYICSFLPEDNAFGGGLGGSYGYYSNVWLTSMIGPFGAGIVIIASLIILLFVRYKLVSTKLMSWVNGGDEKKSDANIKVNETADGEGKASEILEDDSNLGEDENSKLKDEQEQEDDDIYEEEEDENDDDEREKDDDEDDNEDEDEEEADDDDDEGEEDNSANKNQRLVPLYSTGERPVISL